MLSVLQCLRRGCVWYRGHRDGLRQVSECELKKCSTIAQRLPPEIMVMIILDAQDFFWVVNITISKTNLINKYSFNFINKICSCSVIYMHDLSDTIYSQDSTNGPRVDVIVEMLANVNLERDLEMLAFGGRVLVSVLRTFVPPP